MYGITQDLAAVWEMNHSSNEQQLVVTSERGPTHTLDLALDLAFPPPPPGLSP